MISLRAMLRLICLLALLSAVGAAQRSNIPEQDSPIRSHERAALIALYEATDGAQWKNHEGWLGPSGTECSWHGVSCMPAPGNRQHQDSVVYTLDLANNGLQGELPLELSQLTALANLFLNGNAVTGTLPAPMLARSNRGELHVLPRSLAHDLLAISYSIAAPSLFCGDSQLTIGSDGSAKMLKRARRKNATTRAQTYCMNYSGHYTQFDDLAQFLSANAIFTAQPAASAFESSDTSIITIQLFPKHGDPYSHTINTPNITAEEHGVALLFDTLKHAIHWTASGKPEACPDFTADTPAEKN